MRYSERTLIEFKEITDIEVEKKRKARDICYGAITAEMHCKVVSLLEWSNFLSEINWGMRREMDALTKLLDSIDEMEVRS